MFVPAPTPRQEFLLEAFDREDPWGLIASGAPRHEYEPEVEALLRLEESGATITPLLVLETFLRYGSVTGEDLPPLAYGEEHPAIPQEAAEALAAAFAEEDPTPSGGVL